MAGRDSNVQKDPGPEPVPVLVLTGPVAVGKTTVAHEAVELLKSAGIPTAFADLPALGVCLPPPPDDPWNERLVHANLAAVWQNFRAAGAQRLIVARVLENRTLRNQLEEAVPGAAVTTVRLSARIEVLEERILARYPFNPGWYLAAARNLVTSMAKSRAEDHVVAGDAGTPVEIAVAVLRAAGWLDIDVDPRS